MSIRFTHDRLHVGYRAKDWSNVWTEPMKDEDGHQKISANQEGEAEVMLYRFTLGEAGYREPMGGEVKWLPLFDPKNCESSNKREQLRMQKQFLTDAYKYLAEKDPERVRTMEEELDQPGFSRWQTWFKEAKKFKKAHMRQRDNRRLKRIQQAAQAGATEFEIQKQVNSDSSDSAYNSDDEARVETSASTLFMPPPPRPSAKRKSINVGSDGSRTGTKKTKLSNTSPNMGQRQASFLSMSERLGFRPPSVENNDNMAPSRTPSISEDPFVNDNDNDDDDDDVSVVDEIMDARGPNGELPPPFGGNGQPWNFDGITPRSIGEHSMGRNPQRPSVHSNGFGVSTTYSQNQGDGDNDGLCINGEENELGPSERARLHEQEQIQLGIDNNDALKAAIRASLEPQVKLDGGPVVDSIEEGEDHA